MYLKSLDISGFKSFANKTTLDFLPADNGAKETGESSKRTKITVVVGPNGAGKSNISDAMRWVMGEQSMKSLRGRKAEDIIFSGSQQKSQLGAASVTMHFDNSDKRIPLDYDQVNITRKVFRNGDGEYRINGSRARLMDVVDLLAQAGVGKGSYCVVNQGMSDATLTANPAERRVIIEDAAGVKQFQIKKDRALRKLDSTQANLQRVTELTAEIAPHLKILKRQAEKAQKGKEIYDELIALQKNYFAFLWQSFQKEHDSAKADKDDIGVELKNAQREVDKINDAILAESKKVEDANVIHDLHAEKKKLSEDLHAKETKLAVVEGRIAVAKERKEQEAAVTSIPVDVKYIQTRVEEIEKAHATFMEKLANVTSLEEMTAIRTEAQKLNGDIHALYEDAGKAEVDVSQKERDEKLAQHEKILSGLAKDKSSLAADCEALRKKTQDLDQRVTDAMTEDQEARKRFFVIEKELRQKQDVLNKIQERFNEAKIRLAKVEVHEEDLTAEVREELQCAPADLKYNGKELEREKAEKKIARLKSQHMAAGAIDPMIVDEYHETQERFDFLTKESEDLKKAIAQCKEIVKEMDQKIDKEFAKAYKHINEEFKKYFRIIFGGGSAHLTKVKVPVKDRGQIDEEEEKGAESTDAEGEEGATDKKPQKFEIGIEISAHPPGKKVKHLSLLSGGERSLTAIALLFAIISYNPPPFAVLDEIEAALDEANSRRFGRIVKDLAKNTQFVIISHNRETMRSADVLYGVTMGDDGISRLLSVRLDQGLPEGIAD